MDIQKELKSNLSRQYELLPAELFKTSKCYYIFDSNNVNFLEVSEEVYKVVSILKNSPPKSNAIASALPEYSPQSIDKVIEDIADIQDAGFLIPQNFQRKNPYTLTHIKKVLSSKLNSLYLNITSKCNLSCSYCAYGGGYENLNHLEHQEMSWEIARKAIDFFVSRVANEGQLRIDFFGGEPLLAFPLIQRIVTTLKEELPERNQDFAFVIATNGTVLNDKIINFLVQNNFILQISIDGEKEIHNAKRKFRSSDKGSFDLIMRNLKKIHDKHHDYFQKNVHLKAVITTESIDKDGIDFFQLPLIKEIKNQKHYTMVNQTPHYHLEKDEDFFERVKKLGKVLLKKKNSSDLHSLLDGINFKQKHLFYLTLFDFFTIQIVNRLKFGTDESVPYGKDCLIGLEGCVNVDGSISICYKSNSFVVGNVVENTWYFDKIAEFHRIKYAHSAKCKNCFVRRFCNLCYETISGKRDQTKQSIQRFCEFNRHYHKILFQNMLEIMDNNPALWDVLQEMAEKEKDHLEKINSEVHVSKENDYVDTAELA